MSSNAPILYIPLTFLPISGVWRHHSTKIVFNVTRRASGILEGSSKRCWERCRQDRSIKSILLRRWEPQHRSDEKYSSKLCLLQSKSIVGSANEHNICSILLCFSVLDIIRGWAICWHQYYVRSKMSLKRFGVLWDLCNAACSFVPQQIMISIRIWWVILFWFRSSSRKYTYSFECEMKSNAVHKGLVYFKEIA